jgi:hypothetical protein
MDPDMKQWFDQLDMTFLKYDFMTPDYFKSSSKESSEETKYTPDEQLSIRIRNIWYTGRRLHEEYKILTEKKNKTEKDMYRIDELRIALYYQEELLREVNPLHVLPYGCFRKPEWHPVVNK